MRTWPNAPSTSRLQSRARGGDKEVFYEDDRGVPMAIFFEVPDPIPFEDEVDYLLAGGRLNIFVSSLDGLDVVMTKLQFLFGIPSSRIQLSAYGLQIARTTQIGTPTPP